jgi:hypothetical protein
MLVVEAKTDGRPGDEQIVTAAAERQRRCPSSRYGDGVETAVDRS